jgi:hypothetical protein
MQSRHEFKLDELKRRLVTTILRIMVGAQLGNSFKDNRGVEFRKGSALHRKFWEISRF